LSVTLKCEQSDIKIVPHADCPMDKTSGHTNDDTFFVLEKVKFLAKWA